MKNPFINADGKIIPKNKSVIDFAEDLFAFGLIIILTVTTLIIKIMQDNLHMQVLNADAIIVNFGFLFACIAGIITWRENKHLSLAAVTEKLPEKVKKVIDCITEAVTPMILIQLFLTALCQLVNRDQFVNKVFASFSERIFFFFMPVCYIAMVVMSVSRRKNKIAGITGIVLGIITSMSAITGILWYVTGQSEFPALFKIFDLWNLFCEKSVWFLVIAMILLAFAGVPLFVVIGGITFVLFSKSGGYVDMIILEAHAKLTDKNVTAIPLFTIAGYILAQGSAGKRFVNLFSSLFGWFRGGTVVATVLVLTFFSTFTGVSGVTILALGSLLSIILTGSGYNKDRAESLITSSGALGLLFPPSVAIIMYFTSNITQFSKGFDITNLFVAALIPGTIMAVAMIVMGIIFDKNTERTKFSIKAILSSLKECTFELLLPVLFCLTYFTGFFNLFQVASFAVIYTFCLETFIRKDFTLRQAARVVAESVPVSGGVLFIIGAAAGLSYFMQDANVPEIVTEFITTYVSNKYAFLFLMNIVLLIVGCLMDLYSAILIISPLLLYAGKALGIPEVQSGVIFLMNLSIGFLTPPVGMDLFISSYAFKKPVSKVIKGVMPFLAVQIAVLLLVTYVPALTTCLVKESPDAIDEVEPADAEYEFNYDSEEYDESLDMFSDPDSVSDF